jgi:hypothetical protein
MENDRKNKINCVKSDNINMDFRKYYRIIKI